MTTEVDDKEQEGEEKPVYDPTNFTKEGLEDLLTYPSSTPLPRLSTAPTDSRFPNINQTTKLLAKLCRLVKV